MGNYFNELHWKIIRMHLISACSDRTAKSSFIWTNTSTDGSKNYLEHCRYMESEHLS